MPSLESLVTPGARGHARRLVGVALSIGAVSCAEPMAESAAVLDEPLAQQAEASQPASLRDPQGLYFAKVTTNGTGCPAGTATTKISNDGLQFTTTFTQFSAIVNATNQVDTRECMLAIQLSSPQNRAYSIISFTYSGYASLDEGVTARQTASYYFQGNPVKPTESNRVELVGPRAEPYRFSEEVPVRDRSWSPCGVSRDLNVTTRIQLTNSTPKRNGFLSLSLFDGSAKITFNMLTRSCDSGASDAVPSGSGIGPVASSPAAPTNPKPSSRGPSSSLPAPWTGSGANPVQNAPIASPPIASPPIASPPMASPPSAPSSGFGEVTMVTVQPSVVRRDQRFRVSWTPGVGQDASTRHRLRFTRFGDASGQLVWETIETSGTFFDVEPGRLPVGDYEVVVASRNGTRGTYSVPALVRIFDSAAR